MPPKPRKGKQLSGREGTRFGHMSVDSGRDGGVAAGAGVGASGRGRGKGKGKGKGKAPRTVDELVAHAAECVDRLEPETALEMLKRCVCCECGDAPRPRGCCCCFGRCGASVTRVWSPCLWMCVQGAGGRARQRRSAGLHRRDPA
jgi:hypothetical protein